MEADRLPGILARVLGSMMRKVRETAELSYDEAAVAAGCDADWLIRVETGFAAAGPRDIERILTGYGARGARVADDLIELARRAANPPPWLERHAAGMTAMQRDVLLVEAQATLAQVHGCRLVPQLAQCEAYFRDIAPGVYPGCDVDKEWDLVSCRQSYRPAGVTRLLEVMVDESAFMLRLKDPAAMTKQIAHLIELGDRPYATVRVIPWEAPFWEERACDFDVLSFAGTADRVGVSHTILGAALAPPQTYDVWTRIADNAAASPADSRAILERRLAGPPGPIDPALWLGGTVVRRHRG